MNLLKSARFAQVNNVALMLVCMIKVSRFCSLCPLQFHQVGWGMHGCNLTVDVISKLECAVACVLDTRCRGANILIGESHHTCKLCLNLDNATSESAPTNSSMFLFPYNFEVDPTDERISYSVPCAIDNGFAIHLSAVPIGKMVFYLHEQKCSGSMHNCFVDFFFDIRFLDNVSQSIVLNKKERGAWLSYRVDLRVSEFQLYERFHMFLIVSASTYSLIVNGKELVVFPKGPLDISSTAKVYAVLGESQSVSFFCPNSC